MNIRIRILSEQIFLRANIRLELLHMRLYIKNLRWRTNHVTRMVLQSRSENGMGTFREKEKTLCL